MLLRLHRRLRLVLPSIPLRTTRYSAPMPPKRKIATSNCEEILPEKGTRRRKTVEKTDTIKTEQVREATESVLRRNFDRETQKGKRKALNTEGSLSGIQRTDTFQVAETEGTCSCEEQPEPTTQPKRKGKSKGVDLSEPLARQTNSPWKVGAHVSSAGGVENAVLNAFAIGATSFALFLKSQRKWESPPLSSESISEFKKNMKQYGYSNTHVLPHGSYLINLANPDQAKRQKSYDCFLDDLKRCELLGLELYNFHPGSTLGEPLDTAVAHIAQCINDAHAATSVVTIVLENMAGAGNIIGSDFSHLASIIKLVDDKSRIGVCIDTCHAFAAGYDIRTNEGWGATMDKFDEVVGLKYLRGMHINDSKTEFNSRRDRHESIGLGYLGLQAFKNIVNDPRTKNIPLVLETPSFEQPRDVWGKEIEVLQRISGFTSSPPDKPVSSTNVKLDGVLAELGPEDDAAKMVEHTEEIRSAVKMAEKNEKKPGGARTRKAVGRKKVERDDDEDDEGGGDEQESEVPETQETQNGNRTSTGRKGRKATTKKATSQRGRRKGKDVLEDDASD